MATHSAEELAAFQDGEVRFLYARHTETAELVFLEEGTAQAQRALTKSSLRCPIPGCPSPALTTVGPKAKRHGYRHLGGGEHAAEGMFHIQGCEVIAVWLRGKYPTPGYRVQKEERSNAAGERRADVMVTNLTTGKRIAFEIQYAGLKVEEWQERHDSYARQGIPDVWLFGHAGKQFHVDKRHPDEVRLSPTHEAVVEAGLALLWINPFTKQIGTAVSRGHAQSSDRTQNGTDIHSTHVDIPTVSGSGRLLLSAMNDFTLVASGMKSDLLAQLARNREADAAYWRESARREALRQAGIAREKAILEARAEAKKLWWEKQRSKALAVAARLEPAWQESDEYQAVLHRFGGRWPTCLNVEITRGRGIPLPAGQWQSALFTEFWEGRPTGYPISESKCAAFLAVPGIPETEVALMVREWLRALSLARYAEVHLKRRWDGSQTISFTVRMPVRQSTQELATGAAASTRMKARRAQQLDKNVLRQEAQIQLDQIQQEQRDLYEADRNRRHSVPPPGQAHRLWMPPEGH